MTVTTATPPAEAVSSRAALLGRAALIVVVGWLAYSRTFSAPFVFDDHAAVVGNASIRHLSALGEVLTPPHAEGVTVGGRPIVNLTLAINYAMSGEAVWSYHALNLLIHLGAGLLLFGLVRRTLVSPVLRARFGAVSADLAAVVAAVWTLHPLQTESVTYIAQRAESLMGFFFLLTLYAFVRAIECHPLDDKQVARRRMGWWGLVIGACALGMGSKEVMAVAPVIILLYDRTFVAGSFGGAWRERRGFYVALALTWLIVAWLAIGTGGRGGTAGFATPVSVWNYALTQCGAIPHYLRLALWPQPLIFDYGVDVVRDATVVLLPALVLISLLAATITALVRRPVWGFLGACFFVILAPSSSFIPVGSQPIAEHRLYLPLAAVIAMVVLGGYAWLGRRSLWLWCPVALVCGVLTWRRNETYGSELALWSDTVVHRPTNARAQNNLGNALLAAGRPVEAIPHYEEALRLSPDYADAENNLGRALANVGQLSRAIVHYEAALQANPRSTATLMNYGSALAQSGKAPEAIAIYQRALAIEPTAVGVRYNLGNAQLQLGQLDAAAKNYAEVVRLDPAQNDARFNLAAALLRLDRPAEARAQYEEILRRAPDDAAAHAELANLLAHAGRIADAVAHYETALRLRPDFPAVQAELARLRAKQ